VSKNSLAIEPNKKSITVNQPLPTIYVLFHLSKQTWITPPPKPIYNILAFKVIPFLQFNLRISFLGESSAPIK